eukprot:CAMPEP_0184499568 /NCGR_PEP_ID=MMETSP0113_2-20130426/41829_1 /TAXON_ID=91329 /ORGANISM="Norrisiella sphaerica, Strain BC52" /LENGTH=988 /DNA_ID=CAMNT_0026887507 /DNA_START=297 /DNA_END=3263 /DNA_ORIENTATION=+
MSKKRCCDDEKLEPLTPLASETLKTLASDAMKSQRKSDHMMRCVYDFDTLLTSHIRNGKERQMVPYYELQGVTDTTLVFESRFESGNLLRAYQLSECQYELQLRPDLGTNSNMQWFFFKVSNTRMKLDYRFIISNFYKSSSLFSEGMRPLIFSEKEFKKNKVGWRRFGVNICYFPSPWRRVRHKGQEKNCGALTFDFRFDHGHDDCYIAMCYPYTYSHLLNDIRGIKRNIYTQNHLKMKELCRTLAGNACPYLQISQGISAPIRTGESPEHDIVVMARVHPGETNASWMMKGLLHFLVDDSDKEATELRNKCTFHIIPMLNPDGVINGNYRCSLACVDLNRCWDKPNRNTHPTVYYAKDLIANLKERGKLAVVVDLHGHSKKMNIFMYGCKTSTLLEKVLPRIIWDKGSNFFDFKSCSFNVGKNKDGTARVALWKDFGIQDCFTLEASFAGANFGQRENYHFSSKDYEEMGNIIGRSLLKFLDEDEKRRILTEIIKDEDGSCEDENSDGGSDSASEAEYGAAAKRSNYNADAHFQTLKDTVQVSRKSTAPPLSSLPKANQRKLTLTQLIGAPFKGHAAARALKRIQDNERMRQTMGPNHHSQYVLVGGNRISANTGISTSNNMRVDNTNTWKIKSVVVQKSKQSNEKGRQSKSRLGSIRARHIQRNSARIFPPDLDLARIMNQATQKNLEPKRLDEALNRPSLSSFLKRESAGDKQKRSWTIDQKASSASSMISASMLPGAVGRGLIGSRSVSMSSSASHGKANDRSSTTERSSWRPPRLPQNTDRRRNLSSTRSSPSPQGRSNMAGIPKAGTLGQGHQGFKIKIGGMPWGLDELYIPRSDSWRSDASNQTTSVRPSLKRLGKISSAQKHLMNPINDQRRSGLSKDESVDAMKLRGKKAHDPFRKSYKYRLRSIGQSTILADSLPDLHAQLTSPHKGSTQSSGTHRNLKSGTSFSSPHHIPIEGSPTGGKELKGTTVASPWHSHSSRY